MPEIKKIQLGLEAEHSSIEITKELQDEFNKLYDFITTSLKKANEQDKPLVLLVGENHFSLKSFFLKNLIIDMACQLGIMTVGYEATKEDLAETNRNNNTGYAFLNEFLIDTLYLSKTRQALSSLNPESAEYNKLSQEYIKLIRNGQDGAERLLLRTIHHIASKQMRLVPIDHPYSRISHEVAISDEMIKLRDQHMSNVLSLEINAPNNNTRNLMAVVGSRHLPGIRDLLEEKCFVLTIDTASEVPKTVAQMNTRIKIDASIFIRTEQGQNTAYKVYTNDAFAKNFLHDEHKGHTVDFLPSKDFFNLIQRESFKTRAALGIPRTILLMLNTAKSVYNKPDHSPSIATVKKGY